MRTAYITYDEAQKLIPMLKYAKKNAKWKDARISASRLLSEIEGVKPGSYEPFRGHQMFLSEVDYNLLMDSLTVIEDK